MTPEYHRLVQNVASDGERVECRGQTTFEALGLKVSFSPGDLILRPGTNRALGYMELLQLLAGTFDLAALKRVAPKADHSLFTPNMAYGPRVRNQLLGVVRKLEDDPTTRQAVLYVGSGVDGPERLPCTSTIQFILRDRVLHTYVTMRSWDLVKGLTYDAVMFGGLALAVEALVGNQNIIAGHVTVNAGSAHVYESDLDKLPVAQLGHRFFYFNTPTVSEWTTARLGYLPAVNLHRRVNAMRMWALERVCDESWTRGAPDGIDEV